MSAGAKRKIHVSAIILALMAMGFYAAYIFIMWLNSSA
jgi:hypothetical protein